MSAAVTYSCLQSGRFSLKIELCFFFICFNLYAVSIGNEQPIIPGHFEPLGSHRPAEGRIQEVHGFLDGSTFFHTFVNASKAVLFKGLCNNFKAKNAWNDEYLRINYGEVEINVDVAKEENRYLSATQLKLKKFLQLYKKENLYMIDTVPKAMQRDLEIPSVVSCGGFVDKLQDIVLWFNSGNSKSHLHMDTVENINCMISGTKEWFLVDLENSAKILMDHEEGDYCSVNVEKVDMLRYPFLKDLPWWRATVEEGDCLYVPHGWAHQVSSSRRNIAVNFWWTPMTYFNHSDCQVPSKSRSILDVEFNFASQYRFLLQQLLKSNKNLTDFASMNRLILSEHTGRKIISRKDFDLIDKNKDGLVDSLEIEQLTPEELETIFDKIEPGTVNIKGKAQLYEKGEVFDGEKIKKYHKNEEL